MAIILSDSIRVGQQKPIEDRYFNGLTPYADVDTANATILSAVRHIGLMVNINKELYWYKNGIADEDLIPFKTNTEGTASIMRFDELGDLPVTGDEDILYATLNDNKLFLWDNNNGNYIQVGGSFDIDWGNIVGTLSNQTDLQDALNDKVAKNSAITGATKTKITYDSKGLVTTGADLSKTDIPNIDISQVNNLGSTLGEKADLVAGRVPSSQLPSYVDDVLEGTYINTTTFNDLSSNPYIPETGKIYVDTTSNIAYRWGGSIYTEISKSLALGETDATAYRGDRGKAAYDHSQITNGTNPHNTTAENIPYDNDESDLTATDVQAAIDEIAFNIANVGGVFQYNNNDIERPLTGNPNILYIDTTTNDGYYWYLEYEEYVKLGAFTSDFIISLSGSKTLGRYANGATVAAEGKTAKEVLLMAAVEPINPTVSLTSGTSVAFNQSSINNSLDFSYTINSLGASVASFSLEWRRNNTGSWTVLSSNPALSSPYSHSFTDPLSFSGATNAGGTNVHPFNYRLIITDTAGATTTQTLNITPVSYSAPTISTSASATRDRGNLGISLSGNVTRNSANVALTNYTIQVSINGGAYSNVTGSTTSISGSNPSYSFTQSDSGWISTNVDSNTNAYRLIVIDAYQTYISSSGINSAATTFTFTHRNFLGYSTNTTLSLSDVLGLGNSTLTNSKVRTVSGVTASGGNYTYYVYAASAGDLIGVELDGSSPVLGAFTKQTPDVTGTNSYGAAVTYRIYKSNSTNAFTSNSLAFS